MNIVAADIKDSNGETSIFFVKRFQSFPLKHIFAFQWCRMCYWRREWRPSRMIWKSKIIIFTTIIANTIVIFTTIIAITIVQTMIIVNRIIAITIVETIIIKFVNIWIYVKSICVLGLVRSMCSLGGKTSLRRNRRNWWSNIQHHVCNLAFVASFNVL